MVVVKVRYLDGSSRRLRFDTTFTIGTRPECAIPIDARQTPMVVTIALTGPDVMIEKGHEGVLYLNGWIADRDFVHVLHVGDQVRVAGLVLLFELVAGTTEEVQRLFGEVPSEPDATERNLLAALRAEPQSGEEREVYADWLDGVGRCSEAEFVRLQWLSQERLVLDRDAFSSEWMSHQPRAVQLRLRDLAQLSDPERRALVSRPNMICRDSECDRRWERLEIVADTDLFRRCTRCKADVEFCSTFEQLQAAGNRRRRVAIDPILVQEAATEAYWNPHSEYDEPTNPQIVAYNDDDLR